MVPKKHERRAWILVSLGWLYFAIIGYLGTWDDYKVFRDGETVNATFIGMSDKYIRKRDQFADFVYNGDTFSKNFGSTYADDHRIGDVIKFRHIPGDKKEYEIDGSSDNYIIEFVACTLFALAFVFCIYKAVVFKL